MPEVKPFIQQWRIQEYRRYQEYRNSTSLFQRRLAEHKHLPHRKVKGGPSA
jgi:hypothetical protein